MIETKTLVRRTTAPAAARPSWLKRACRRVVHGLLARLEAGEVRLVESDEVFTFGRATQAFPLRVTVRIGDPAFYSFLALGGSNGAADSFIRGHWNVDDLAGLVRIFVRNRDVLDSMENGWAKLAAPALALAYWLERNTVDGSRRNIAAHYDLGNEFFGLFLDPSMMYSCAWFEHEGQSLEAASFAKLDRICRKLDLGPDDHVLEIGTGWGGFAIHAARRYGCRVTTTTISEQQYVMAGARVREAGLADRVTILKEDYRHLEGTYDKVVSIEMIEAVGHKFYDTFFRAVDERLAPDGIALLQAIVITDQHYDRARREVDFIKKYVFPGSCIPSISTLVASATRASNLRLFDLEDLTPHYAETLRHWRAKCDQNHDAIRALGYPEEFTRMWSFYLAYCEGGFEERFIGNTHMVFTKPDARPAPVARSAPLEIGGWA